MNRRPRGSVARASITAACLALFMAVASCAYPGPRPWLKATATEPAQATQAAAVTPPATRSVSSTDGADMSKLSAQETELIKAARADLSKRLGIAAEQVAFASIEAQEFADTSLGCPEQGKLYAQVIVSGYRILLQMGGKQYDYRSDGRHVRLCENMGGA